MRILAAIYARLRPANQYPLQDLTPPELANLSRLVRQFRTHSHNTPLPPHTLDKLTAARQLALQHAPSKTNNPHSLPLSHTVHYTSTIPPSQSSSTRLLLLLGAFSLVCAIFTYAPSDTPTPYSSSYLDAIIDADQLGISPYFTHSDTPSPNPETP